MNRFLLLSLTAGLLSPIDASAETWWMMAAHRAKTGTVTWEVPIGSYSDCEAAGKRFIEKDWGDTLGRFKNYLCVKGK